MILFKLEQILDFSLKQFLIVSIIVLSLFVHAGTEYKAEYKVPQVRLPLMNAAPVIDGTITPGEWGGAARMNGLGSGPVLAPQSADVYVGSDGKTLFIAVVSETQPGGKLVAKANPLPLGTNPMTFRDDSVEIVVDPLRDTHGKRDVYHAIINAKGAIWQQSFGVGGGKSDAWIGNWRVGSKIVGDRWIMEVAIPLSDLGLTNVTDKTMGIRVARCYQQSTLLKSQTEWSPLGGDFNNPDTMPVVTWDPAAPVVQMLQLQDELGGPANLRLQIHNSTASQLQVRSVIKVTPKNSMPTERVEELVLAPGEIKAVELKPTAPAGELLFTHIQVSSADGMRIFYKRDFSWQIDRPAKLWTNNQEEVRQIDTSFAYYPYSNAMKVRVSLAGLACKNKVSGVKLEIRETDSKRNIASIVMPAIKNAVTELNRWDLPPLDGKYELLVNLQGIEAKPEVLPFVRYHFPWEHNTLGKSDILVPPFTAIQVQGNTISTVLRRHTMNALGLWEQVEAIGQPLMKAPMRIEVKFGGKVFTAKGVDLRFTEQKPTEVTVKAKWSAGPLQGATTSVWDFDGMMKATMELQPVGEPVEAVTLVVPLDDRQMPLMNAVTDGLRFNYAGETPLGQCRIWSSDKAPRNSIIGSYVPYIWVGAQERGLAVFGENDAGWITSPQTPCQELVRNTDGSLELRLNLVAKPSLIKETRTIVLGFQATPVKPMPENWRWWTISQPLPKDVLSTMTGGYRQVFIGATNCVGALTPFCDIYPRDEDFSIYAKLSETRRTGKIDREFFEKWLTGYRAPTIPGFGTPEEFKKNIRGCVNYGFQVMANKPDKVVVYIGAAGVRTDTTEGQTFLNEWVRDAFTARFTPYGSSLWYDMVPLESYRDYAVWYYKKILENFVADGLYWDNCFLKSNFNTVSTAAYGLPDGNIQPSDSLWELRALARRTAVMLQEMGKPNLNMMHMTNTAIAPVQAFAMQNLTWEDRSGRNDYQDRFSRSYIQAESTGRQFGNVTTVLTANVACDPKTIEWLDRTQSGVVLTHELRMLNPKKGYLENYNRMVRFGYGRPEVKVWNYWQHDFPLTITGDETSSLVMSKPGQVMIIVCDYGKGGAIQLKLNLDSLNLKGRLTAMDMESDKSLDVSNDGKIEFSLAKHDFKVIMVKEGTP